MSPTGFQVFDTRDPDVLASRLGQFFGDARLDLCGGKTKFRCRIKHLTLGDAVIIHGKYGTGFKVRFQDFNTFAGSPALLNGTGEHEIGGRNVSVSKDSGVILSPGGAMLHVGPQFEHLSMAVRPTVLMSRLAAIVGDLRLGPLQFDPAVNGRDPKSKQLERLLRFVAAEVELSSPMPLIMQSELPQLIITSFLLSNPNNYSELLHGEPIAAAPWQVRRAEQYIEANWNQPITIEALVAATGVSARSLFSSFKARRGYSPMDFVKRVRLGRARQKLSRPDAGASVTAVAFECGFGNPGHFAAAYRDHFGERPSETLRRGRGGHATPGPDLGQGMTLLQ